MLFNRLMKFKFLQLIAILVLVNVLGACTGDGSGQAPNTPIITISSFTESAVSINESTTAVVSINQSNLTILPVFVMITSNNSNIINVSPTICILTIQSNKCSVVATGVAAGTASFSAIAKGFTTATSKDITVNPNGPITISSFTESAITVNESTSAVVSINSPNLSASPVTVTITNNNSSVINVSPTSCIITAQTNECKVTVTGISAGTGNFTASADDFGSTISNTVTVKLSGVFFGNNAGLAYRNDTLLAGTSQALSIDGNVISGVVINSNNSVYVATATGTPGGKVYSYIESSGLWVAVPGSGPGYTLDGSAINVFTLNNNSMYAGTTNGNLFIYANNGWNRIGTTLNGPIQTLTFDQNNIPYVGTQNGLVYKYINSVWQNLTSSGSVDGNGTQINSLAISHDGKIYAATGNNNSGTPGQVYQYVSGTWQVISSFTANPLAVNSLVIFNDILYAGMNVNNTTGDVWQYNGGSSWTQLAHQPGTTAINTLLVNSGVLYAATTGDSTLNGQVYRYNNSSWTQLSTLSNGQISALAVQNGYYYAATTNTNAPNFNIKTLYKYSASQTGWTPVGGINAVDSSTMIFSTAVDSSGSFYVGTLYNVYKYNTTLSEWLPLGVMTSGDQSGISAISTYNGITYAITFAGNVFYNSDNSSDWTQTLPIPNVAGNASGNMFSAIDSTGKLYAAMNISSTDTGDTTVGNVWQYDNVHNVWKELSGSGAYSSLDGSQIQALTTDKSNNLYAGTNVGLIWEYQSGGSSWSLVGTGAPEGSAQITSITTDSNNNIYVGTSLGSVYEYNGVIWFMLGFAAVDGSLINTVTFDSAGRLYAVTGAGNVWQYSFTNSSWTILHYGNGILVGSNNMTPAASGF